MPYLACDFWQDLLDRGDLLPFVAVVGGFAVGTLAIVFSSVKEIVVRRAQEATRREVAAYVAEKGEPFFPPKLETVTMCPEPRSSISGKTRRVSVRAPSRFTRTIFSMKSKRSL